MPQLRIGIAQVDVTVGALDANAALILARAREAAEQGAHVVVFGAMALTGFPLEDLAKRASFARASQATVDELAHDLVDAGLGDAGVLVGGLAITSSGTPVNRTYLLRSGRAEAVLDSTLQPGDGGIPSTAGGSATASGGTQPVRIDVGGHRIALAVGAALPSADMSAREGGSTGDDEVLIVLDAQQYVEGGPARHVAELAGLAAARECPLVHVNLAGAQDDVVFAGGSSLLGADGNLLARAPLFDEHLVAVDLPTADGSSEQGYAIVRELEPDAEVYSAIVTGLRAYVRKNGFRSVVLGMSGGIDSALLAALAADAIGGENVVGVSMPSSFSSEHSRTDAQDLAERLGAHLLTHPIEDMVNVFTAALDLEGVAQENLQARIRGLILMGLSNAHGHLVLAPGNKSELAVGYSTIYGDAVGGYAPLKDLVKSRVWALARWRNNSAIDAGQIPPIPESSITKPPSAELRPGQVDQDSLPPYEVLDPILEGYIERHEGHAELVDAGFDAAVVERVIGMVDRAEWKRRQFAIGPRVTPVALGGDRHMPVTNAWHEQERPAAILDVPEPHEEPA